MIRERRVGLMAAVLGFAAWAGDARAGLIAWSSPRQISGDADVLTNGTADRAYVFGGGGDTINGVAFTNFANQAGDTSNITGTASEGTFGAGNGSLGGPYRDLVSNSIYGSIGTFTLNGLTAGASYEVEVWVNDSRGGGEQTRSETISGSPTLQFNTAQAEGGLGQYLVGTFVADASRSQTLAFAPVVGGVVQLNGLQLRDLSTAAAVPEPSSLCLCAIGGLAASVLAASRRRPRA